MNDTFKILLTSMRDALGAIGMSIDIEDRGLPEEAEREYEQAREKIRKALDDASAEDRETFRHLFGFETDFNKTSWPVHYEYIQELLNTNPEISLQQLRLRVPRFLESIERLKNSTSAVTETAVFQYTKHFQPSLLQGFRMLITQQSGPPGWYYERQDGLPSFHFSLEGDGFRLRVADKTFEYDMLLHGVWIHCLHPMKERRQEIKLKYENESARNRVWEPLCQALRKESWELVRT